MIFERKLPRVHITYDIPPDGNVSTEIPFAVGVIADLYGDSLKKPEYIDRTFIEINHDNFAEVMERCQPTFICKVQLPRDMVEQELRIIFNEINAFEPDNIVRQIHSDTGPQLNGLLSRRSLLGDLLLKCDINREFAKSIGTLGPASQNADAIIAKYGSAELIGAFQAELIQGHAGLAPILDDGERAKNLIKQMIFGINKEIGQFIDQIIHNPALQALEARWRSLFRLTRLTKEKNVKVKILSATINEMRQEFHLGFDNTKIFHEIYETGYGTMGGQPFACMIFDEYFDKTANDIDFLRYMSKICEAAHVPLLTGASPNIFGVASFKELTNLKDLELMFSGSEWLQWNRFRQEPGVRYINMVLPRVLVREPYKIGSRSVDLFAYEEKITTDRDLCWGNAAYCFAEKILEAYVRHGWAASIRGIEGGGMVQNLPNHSFGMYGESRCMEFSVSDRLEHELGKKLGFIALCQKLGSNNAVFFSGQSLQDPIEDSNNALLAARTSYVLSASRFAHYIKIIMRDKIGSFQSAEQLQVYLQNWLGSYVLLSDEPENEALKARFPLREGRIWVRSADVPGEYSVRIELRPHFQMESVQISLGFVAKFNGK